VSSTVRFDASLKPVVARFDLWAQLLDVGCAGLAGGAQLGYCASRRQQQKR
jgi:hypothetical protein